MYCGDSCLKCSWSWPPNDPSLWTSIEAACRCEVYANEGGSDEDQSDDMPSGPIHYDTVRCTAED